MKNSLRLVNFESTDHLQLPGILYEPEKKSDKALIYLHGNGSSSVFYNAEKMNLFAEGLNKTGISFFAFNNRGAHWIKKLDKITGDKQERLIYGMTYELIKECIYDIEGAINFLKKLGYSQFYLAGASTGANKIVVYNFYRRKNPVEKYILISGGDDEGLYYNFYFKKTRKKFNGILKKSKELIDKGQGRKLVPSSLIPDQLISYQSLYDTINPDGDYNIFPFYDYLNNLKLGKKELFREFKTINKPALVVNGGEDEYCYGQVAKCVAVLKKENPRLSYKIIPGADHGYTGKEKELIGAITDWL